MPAQLQPAQLLQKGLKGGALFGPFHLKIKEQEKCFISSLCFLQSRLFFLQSSSPSPLFVAYKQPLSVELSLRFWPLSSLCPGLLCYLFSSTTALPRAGRLPAARILLFLQVSWCKGWEEHKAPGKRLAVPSIRTSLPRNRRISPRINWGSILSRSGHRLESSYVLSQCPEARFLNDFQ